MVLTTRIAPTPSGFLHIGNVANALLVHWLATQPCAHSGRARTWRVALRIDDEDTDRVRLEYVADIFSTLSWLGITWDLGPHDVQEYLAGRAVKAETADPLDRERMRAAVLDMRDRGQFGLRAFVCACSRGAITRAHGNGCVADCSTKNLPLLPHETAVRLRITPGLTETMDGQEIDLSVEHGDPVLWRRDDRPAYHLATVWSDEQLQTTHIVRGEDLRTSSALHRALARVLGKVSVTAATFMHHGLLTDDHGVKLSKSHLRTGQPLPHTEQVAAMAIDLARALGAPLGITPPDRSA